MLHTLDDSLASFLRATVPLPPPEIDVSFELPDADWAERVTRATINLYLWDVRPNRESHDAGVELVVGPDGVRRRHPALPRLDCRYWLTAWTPDVRSEHALLGATLRVLLGHPDLDPHLPLGYSDQAPPPTLEVVAGPAPASRPGIDGHVKPGLDLLLTAAVTEEPAMAAEHRAADSPPPDIRPAREGW